MTNNCILIVGKKVKNLEILTNVLNQEGYHSVALQNAVITDDKWDFIEQHNIVAGLIDVTGLKTEIWEVCEQLRKRNIPFITISQQQSSQLRKISMKHGADSMLTKPLTVRELIQLLHRLTPA